jgi:hypothetical protein
MTDEQLTTVYTTYDEGCAEVVRVALEEAGIPCVLDNQHQAGLTGVLQVRIQVREMDVDRAREFIKRHDVEPR